MPLDPSYQGPQPVCERVCEGVMGESGTVEATIAVAVVENNVVLNYILISFFTQKIEHVLARYHFANFISLT